MSKWNDSLHKKTAQDNMCICTNDTGLFLPNRQLSGVIAGLIFLLFAFFMAGYFVGKMSSTQEFTDHVTFQAQRDNTYFETMTFKTESDDLVAPADIIVAQSVPAEPETNAVAVVEENENKTHYYAQLIGFGTEKAAQKFSQKLLAKNIETSVKKHVSKTAKGKNINWYQVVTLPYGDKNELTIMVDALAKQERLSGVKICTC